MDVEDFLYNVMHENYSTEVEDGSLPVVRWFAITSRPCLLPTPFQDNRSLGRCFIAFFTQISRLLSVLYVDCTRKKNFAGLQKLLDRFNDNGKVYATHSPIHSTHPGQDRLNSTLHFTIVLIPL